jgi:hypothetical protein
LLFSEYDGPLWSRAAGQGLGAAVGRVNPVEREDSAPKTARMQTLLEIPLGKHGSISILLRDTKGGEEHYIQKGAESQEGKHPLQFWQNDLQYCHSWYSFCHFVRSQLASP